MFSRKAEPAPKPSLTLYGDPVSGNVYKVQLLCALIGREYAHVPTSWNGGTEDPAFRKINPNGKVPAIVDDGLPLWESNAILQYLANGTPYWPDDRVAQAQVLQWMFFEQYSHEPYIAVSRAIAHAEKDPVLLPGKLAEKRGGGMHALSVMEQHLSGRQWFVGETPTIADIALYAYTHVAHEGGFDLGAFPAVAAWCRRLAALPGVVPMAVWA